MKQDSGTPENAPRPIIRSDRPDQRLATTAGVIHHRLKHLRPKLAFDPSFTPEEFQAWREKVRRRLRQVLGLRQPPRQPKPKLIADEPRPGYRLQRWELYPDPDSVVPVMLLMPEAASPQRPAPAVLCLPGSDHPNELLAGEPLPAGAAGMGHVEQNAMARRLVEQGMAALCVENPGTGSLFDLRASDWRRQCMELIWMGSSYEALSVSHKLAALRWLRTLPMIDGGRIAACGHSLGAKPALILGVLEPKLAAVVWNSGAYDWRQRHVVTNLAPVAPWQYVPGMIQWFDYLDLMAALAPMPLLCSEGGRSDELRKVRQAYALAGAAGNFKLSYVPSFRQASQRTLDRQPVPEGVTPAEYLRYQNANNEEHYFKDDVAVPWLKRMLRQPGSAGAGPASPG